MFAAFVEHQYAYLLILVINISHKNSVALFLGGLFWFFFSFFCFLFCFCEFGWFGFGGLFGAGWGVWFGFFWKLFNATHFNCNLFQNWN